MQHPNTIPTDPRDNENVLLDVLFLDRLLAKLSEDERRIMEGHLDGSSPEPHRLKQIVHRLALLARAEWKCEHCGPLPAASFGWNSPTRCMLHEPGSARHKRAQVDRWQRAVEDGERWPCRSCGDEKAADEFRPYNRSRCKTCETIQRKAERAAKTSHRV